MSLPSPRETDIVSACLELLRYRGVMAWRSNTGAMSSEYKGKRRFVRFGRPGVSDIVGILPGGRFIGVETKRPGEKPTEEQRVFLAEVGRRGGVGVLVESVTELAKVLDVVMRAGSR